MRQVFAFRWLDSNGRCEWLACILRMHEASRGRAFTLPPLELLVAFEAAARQLSFTRAAARLRVAQPALSQTILSLERDLGVMLFHRTTRSVALTDAGHELLPALLALHQWGATHARGGGPSVTHADCGEPVQVEVRCASGHAVDEKDVLVGSRHRVD